MIWSELPGYLTDAVVVFGPFEWDDGSRELRRNGVRVRLSRQPAEILKALLEDPGRLVTRERLRETLWGEDTFVDFEQGLNTAVARLRQTLADSAEEPRYVETVPGQGYRFIGEVRSGLAAPDVEPLREPDRGIDRRTALVGGLGAAVGAAGAYFLAGLRFGETDVRRGRFVVSAPPAAPFQPSGRGDVAIAPDGSRLVYAASRSGSAGLYLRSLAETEGRFLPGTDIYYPFFSPDGMEIGYYRFPDQALVRVSSLGGGGSVIVTGIGVLAGASWSPGGDIIFGTRFPDAGLMRVPASGGSPVPVTRPRAGERHVMPDLLPGGRAALFTILPEDADLAPPRVAFVVLESGEYRELLPGSTPKFASSGHLIFALEDRLMAAAFDPERLTVSGTPVPVARDVISNPRGNAQYALSRTGSLVLAVSGVTAGRELVWVTRDGKADKLALPPGRYAYPRISPDGRRAAISARGGQEGGIVLWDFERERLTRMTPASGLISIYPTWLPDGERIAFFSDQPTAGLYWMSVDGGSEAEIWWEADGLRAPYFFTADGELVFARQSSEGVQLCQLATTPGAEPRVLLENARNADLSPDGKRLAYQAEIDGRFEIYVRSFPRIDAGALQVSTRGGVQPVWSPSEDALYYIESGSPARLMRVVMSPEPGALPDLPVAVMDWPYYTGELGRTYDVARPDGDRFIAVEQRGASQPRVEIVLDWFSELEAV